MLYIIKAYVTIDLHTYIQLILGKIYTVYIYFLTTSQVKTLGLGLNRNLKTSLFTILQHITYGIPLSSGQILCGLASPT